MSAAVLNFPLLLLFRLPPLSSLSIGQSPHPVRPPGAPSLLWPLESYIQHAGHHAAPTTQAELHASKSAQKLKWWWIFWDLFNCWKDIFPLLLSNVFFSWYAYEKPEMFAPFLRLHPPTCRWIKTKKKRKTRNGRMRRREVPSRRKRCWRRGSPSPAWDTDPIQGKMSYFYFYLNVNYLLELKVWFP